jgi:hypothetical protein
VLELILSKHSAQILTRVAAAKSWLYNVIAVESLHKRRIIRVGIVETQEVGAIDTVKSLRPPTLHVRSLPQTDNGIMSARHGERFIVPLKREKWVLRFSPLA